MFYFGASPTAAQYLYPLITHLPLYVVLALLSGQKVWPLVAVLTAYLCCQVRRWAALAVALFFPQHPLVQPVAELLFTLPLLLLFIRFLAPSMRQLSCYPTSVQCQFGIVPLVSYLFDYITHVYTNLLSEANPAAVEFMFFVCCAAFLCSILRASRVERQRIQMEQLQTSLNLQVTQAMREIEALRLHPAARQHLPPRPAPPHAVFGGLHRERPHRAGAGLYPQRVQRDRSRQGDRLLRERGGRT